MVEASPVVTEAELHQRLARLPRVALGTLPTPLEPLPRLSELLGVRLFIKRDDLTGLALGGNKVRHLEFTLAMALEQGCDVIINGAAVQSNYCRQTAAACAKLGLKCALVLRRDQRIDPFKTSEPQGNLLLDYLFGADVRFVDADADMDAEKERLAEEYRAKGHKPFVIKHPDLGGGFGYLLCLLELVQQCRQMGLKPTHLIHSSSTPTQVGFVVGAKALGLNWRILGISPHHRPDAPDRIAELSNLVAGRLGLPVRITPDEIGYSLAYVGEGYGIPTKEGMDALVLMARTEGILLDPVYTAKAFAAIVDMARKGKLTKEHTVIFVHTGGVPALFAYQPTVLKALGWSV